MRRANQVTAKEQRWLVEGMVPEGKIVVLAGMPKGGKSLWTMWLAALVSQTAPVILSNQEDDEQVDLIPRLEYAGAVMKRIYLPSERDFPDYGFPVLPGDTEMLERKVKQIGARLVVFDATNQHFSVNVYNNQAVRLALTPLKQMCARTGCTVVFVDHLKKMARTSAGGSPLEAFAGGGSGLVAASRQALIWGHSPDDADERVLVSAGANAAGRKAMTYSLEVEKVVLAPRGGKYKGRLLVDIARVNLVSKDAKYTATQVLRTTSDTATPGGPDVNPTQKSVAAEWLTSFLMYGKKDVTEIRAGVAKAGFSWKTNLRAAEGIGVVKVVKKLPGFGSGTQSTWELPPGHPALALGAKINARRRMTGQAPATPGGDDDE
jgi:hypothetical protein